jgi:hypothetical protein
MFGGSHPFCTNRFVTDGREIFVELHEQTGETSLLEILEANRSSRISARNENRLEQLSLAAGPGGFY